MYNTAIMHVQINPSWAHCYVIPTIKDPIRAIIFKDIDASILPVDTNYWESISDCDMPIGHEIA